MTKEKHYQINVRIPEATRRRLRVASAERGMTQAEIVQQLIDLHILSLIHI